MNAMCGRERKKLVIPFKREGFKPKEAKPLLKKQKMYACSTWAKFFYLFNLMSVKESTLIFGDCILNNEVPHDKPLAAHIFPWEQFTCFMLKLDTV